MAPRRATYAVVATALIVLACLCMLTSLPGFASSGSTLNTAGARTPALAALWSSFAEAYDAAVAAGGTAPIPHIAKMHLPLDTAQAAAAVSRWHAFADLMPPYPDGIGGQGDSSARLSRASPRLFSGRGIVTTGGRYQLGLAYAQLRLLRRLGCQLPVEVWVSTARDGAIAPDALSAFRAHGARVLDLDAVVPPLPALREGMTPEEHGTKPYLLKQLAILSSSCEECLFLDADNAPALDPTFLFDMEEYTSTGLLLWPDFWHMAGGAAAIRSIFGLPEDFSQSQPDRRTVESGQILVDKRRAWRILMLSTYMQIQTRFFDNLMKSLHDLGGGGDKQTFLISCLALKEKCHLLEKPVASAGTLVDGVYCGRTMIQHAPDGRILFVHSNMDKEKYYNRMVEASTWDESLRRCDVIRTPKEEGTWSVQFRHEPSCSWVVKVDANYDETSLRDELHYDLERERYVYVQQWAALVDHTPAEK